MKTMMTIAMLMICVTAQAAEVYTTKTEMVRRVMLNQVYAPVYIIVLEDLKPGDVVRTTASWTFEVRPFHGSAFVAGDVRLSRNVPDVIHVNHAGGNYLGRRIAPQSGGNVYPGWMQDGNWIAGRIYNQQTRVSTTEVAEFYDVAYVTVWAWARAHGARYGERIGVLPGAGQLTVEVLR